MMYLLDTNVVSEMRKVRLGSANRSFAKWANSNALRSQHISAITIEELEIGILRMERRDPAQGIMMRNWMHEQVMPNFAGRIFGYDLAEALRCAKLHVPSPQPIRDAMIAATAMVHGMTVVTRNVSDFEPLGVTAFNPWQE